jgi:hypothetical protein
MQRSNIKSKSKSFSSKSACICTLLLLWILGMAALVFHMADWSDRGVKPESFHLMSYQAASTQEYSKEIPGLQYKNHGGDKKSVSDPAIFKLRDLLHDWNPDDTHEDHWVTSRAHPDQPHNTNDAYGGGAVRRFDYQNPEEMKTALEYREAEIPFIVYNNPELEAALEKLNLPNLLNNFGYIPRMVERSASNHFMYYSAKVQADKMFHWTPPQIDLPVTFSKFLRLAEDAQKNSVYTSNEEDSKLSGDNGLHYMTIGASEGGHTPWIADALPFFSDQRREDNFFIVERSQYHGINCRFGMRGVIAEAHYDGARNFVSMVRGRKRYVLLPPSECDRLHLLPRGHPSARHSTVDWSNIKELDENSDLAEAKATEAIVASGDILYIPSYWFHYIISQDASLQCNARSGASLDEGNVIRECMKNAGRTHQVGSGDSRDKKSKKKQKKVFQILTESQI